ncbi:hypothetical protein BU26DRAFT_176297 [Trematosphaeria pertusa]|uniref:Uncharacterized protein n=1 Tax=Trematosphaeria pertusa TaxID=390896 RepID=A0A6A6HUV5_9PLEO|nr:uncharacterized protein BU26DRAFT_176297 [Trematosphaeria pertusa]KAF2241333.1 hypothetical protein BU26DRAFT_176297 [Trematosphaeria pertusa]
MVLQCRSMLRYLPLELWAAVFRLVNEIDLWKSCYKVPEWQCEAGREIGRRMEFQWGWDVQDGRKCCRGSFEPTGTVRFSEDKARIHICLASQAYVWFSADSSNLEERDIADFDPDVKNWDERLRRRVSKALDFRNRCITIGGYANKIEIPDMELDVGDKELWLSFRWEGFLTAFFADAKKWERFQHQRGMRSGTAAAGTENEVTSLASTNTIISESTTLVRMAPNTLIRLRNQPAPTSRTPRLPSLTLQSQVVDGAHKQ